MLKSTSPQAVKVTSLSLWLVGKVCMYVVSVALLCGARYIRTTLVKRFDTVMNTVCFLYI